MKRLLSRRSRGSAPDSAADADPGYSNFSEDATVRRLLSGSDAPEFCVDIGANDGRSMSNSLRLFESGWAGVAAEVDPGLFAGLAQVHESHPGVGLARFRITPDNVATILAAFETPQDFGFLTLDIDGYDNFVLDGLLDEYRPRVICTEINEKIPPPLRFTVLYSDDYVWDSSHFYGQSICQLDRLCQKHEYALVELEYNNAFLMPRDLAPGSLTPEEAYRAGYADRPDRLERMPWNRDMEELQTMAPEDAVRFLDEKFAGHRGKYQLEL
ncbi:MAG: hypothetical protein WA696_06505 [Solirubrobacterales bacterium]